MRPPGELIPWLTFSGSFMQKCRSRGIFNPTVRVLQEGWQLPGADARKRLQLPCRSNTWIRDVLIESEGRRWMLARSVIPHRVLTGPERRLSHLKTRPLGSVLFRQPKWQRSPFEFICLTPEALDTEFDQTFHACAWARHSLFTLNQKKLLLTEIFLPDFVDRQRR